MEYVYISGWAHGPETGGIGHYSLDENSGKLEFVQSIMEEISFGFCMVDSGKGVLYALNEVLDAPGQRAGGGGSIYAFKLDPADGTPKLLKTVPTLCPNPAYCCLDKTGKFLLVANHSGKFYITKIKQDSSGKYYSSVEFDDSAVELFEINDDGSVGELLDVRKHTGDGPHQRQSHPHPHSAVMSPSGNFFAICDKGNDKVYTYRIDEREKKLVLCGEHTEKGGSLPRYCVFHPSYPYFYHNNEALNTICLYSYTEDGKMRLKAEYPAVPESSLPGGHSNIEQQGLCISRDGKYLYDAINGCEIIAVHKILEDGSLKHLQNQAVGYKWTRGIAITPSGKYMIVTCLKGQKVVLLGISNNGTLFSTGETYDYPNAAYASIWPTNEEKGG